LAVPHHPSNGWPLLPRPSASRRAGRHQVGVGPHGEPRVIVTEILRERLRRSPRVQQHRCAVMAQGVCAVSARRVRRSRRGAVRAVAGPHQTPRRRENSRETTGHISAGRHRWNAARAQVPRCSADELACEPDHAPTLRRSAHNALTRGDVFQRSSSPTGALRAPVPHPCPTR
jgi:hypothetical protein